MKNLMFILFLHNIHCQAQICISDPLSAPVQAPQSWNADNIHWDTVFQDGSRLATYWKAPEMSREKPSPMPSPMPSICRMASGSLPIGTALTHGFLW